MTGKLTIKTDLSVAEQLKRDAAIGVAGKLIGSLTSVGAVVHDFCNTGVWAQSQGRPATGVSIVVSDAGIRGPAVAPTRPNRRDDVRFASSGIDAYKGLNDEFVWRWVAGEIEGVCGDPATRAFPILVVLESNVTNGLTRERLQTIDRLASEAHVALAVQVDAPDEAEVVWSQGVFPNREQVAGE